jgi:hypothetical protein
MDTGSEYAGYNDRRSRQNKSKKGKEKAVEISDDIMYQHRSVSRAYLPVVSANGQYCEKCQRGPADDLLEKAKERKRKSKGKKRKLHDDDMSDEEIALSLEGWLTCERCVVSCHWAGSPSE